ncbi:MAG: type II toxin-antitoxin system VapC family toxin [Tepidisphaeraceae bacterium]
MGSVTLPSTGRVCVDAQVIIYTVEKHPSFGPCLRPLWDAMSHGRVDLHTSELSILESLILPRRRRNQALEQDYLAFLQQPRMRLVPVSRSVLLQAVQLRAETPRLRTPDAIHVATAVTSGCHTFVTNDRQLQSLPELSVVHLHELVG